MNEGNESFNKI